jgi:L-alanine-DL-glutamate epimerase-like enolase superfamily enzyme
VRFRKLVIYHIRLPLKIAFAHARSVRRETDNIVVEAIAENGMSGFGEGVPREYVTGETPESSLRYLAEFDYSLLSGEWDSMESGVARLERHSACIPVRSGSAFPGAAYCALELGLLDALTRSFGATFADMNRCFPETAVSVERPNRVRYSAVCSGGAPTSVALTLTKLRLYRFAAVKLKVGWGVEEDIALLKLARKILGSRTDLRVDVNGAWNTREALQAIPRFEAFRISSVEEPLKPSCRSYLPLLRERMNIPIMLDESICSFNQLTDSLEEGLCDMVNIRLSKCGGFLSSLRMLALLRKKNIGYQLGCQVGETGILSAAGRHFSFMLPGIRHIEGSYDRYLLRQNVTNEDCSFGFGGWARLLKGPGLGVTVNRRAIEKHTVQKLEISL